jgi:N-acetylglucosamine transport system permease protein
MHIAALDSIPSSVYEAASIDGATGIDKFFRITIPLMKDIIGITFIFSLSGTGITFILTSVMTQGGPANATLVLPLYIYNQAFGTNTNVGYSMAITIFSMLLGVLFAVMSRKMSYTNENA